MGVLRLAVLGPPEVFHDESRLTFALRKAQALLWPDSAPHDGRTALRNALALLRTLLANPDASPASHSHLLSERDLLGLDQHAPCELDLAVVQQAWKEAQLHSTLPAEPQRAALVAQCQQALALVRGPFLDGFWLGEDAPFDEWVQQQRWQVRVQLLCDRLSSWQEAAGELEQARATLTRWLALDPLQEEAYRRLMRVHLALGDATAALQVYATCRARLAEELQVKPSADTVSLAQQIRARLTVSRGSTPARPAAMESVPPSELAAPLVGRAAALRHLVGTFQQARGGQPRAVLLVGEAGLGKTRLASEFVAWARAQGAEVLSGHALEMGGRLPYQPLVEALRERLEAENAPEDLLENLWLAELARLLPELRVRYPDLPAPTEDELTAKMRLFEAVARLLDALAKSGPLLLLLEDLHRLDGASLDLLRYLGHSWSRQGSRVLLLGTVRREELELNQQLVDLGRDLQLSQITLQPLSQEETLQLLQALVGEVRERVTAQPAPAGAGPAPARETKLWALGDFLFAHTGGQPLYLLETLKLLREREWLVPRLGTDGVFRLELAVEMATVIAQERTRHELLPPSLRTLIRARLSRLTQPARQLVMASAVLGKEVSAQHLWQVAGLGVQAGLEALEEAVKSGMLCEEPAGAGRPGGYGFAYKLVRDVVYTELGGGVAVPLAAARLGAAASREREDLRTGLSGALDLRDRGGLSLQRTSRDEAMAVFAVRPTTSSREGILLERRSQ